MRDDLLDRSIVRAKAGRRAHQETITQYAICTKVAFRQSSDPNAETVLRECPFVADMEHLPENLRRL
ncbi:hypothetical protein [Gardnerella sp. KA00747]|uniref:hypothetical protein n=1 Tax=Gardnerella sp. KA00747 TaxID=2749078 RepID=UPI003BAAE4B4